MGLFVTVLFSVFAVLSFSDAHNVMYQRRFYYASPPIFNEAVGYMLIADEDVEIAPGSVGPVNTGLSLYIPKGVYGWVSAWLPNDASFTVIEEVISSSTQLNLVVSVKNNLPNGTLTLSAGGVICRLLFLEESRVTMLDVEQLAEWKIIGNEPPTTEGKQEEEEWPSFIPYPEDVKVVEKLAPK